MANHTLPSQYLERREENLLHGLSLRILRPCGFPWCIDKSVHLGCETRLHPAMNTPARIVGTRRKLDPDFPTNCYSTWPCNARPVDMATLKLDLSSPDPDRRSAAPDHTGKPQRSRKRCFSALPGRGCRTLSPNQGQRNLFQSHEKYVIKGPA
jgi:hypothetical protein